MAAMVQAYPQQTGTITMLQTRPSPAPGLLPGQSQSGQQYSQVQRSSFHGIPGGVAGPAIYRGPVGPIQPYAFTSTPSLNTSQQWQQFGGYRTASTPNIPTMRTLEAGSVSGRSRRHDNAPMTNLSYNPAMGLGKRGSRDDSSIQQPRSITTAPRPQSAYLSGSSTQYLSLTQATPVKISPDRYRRPGPSQHQSRPPNSAFPSGSGMAPVNHLYHQANISDQRVNSAGARFPQPGARPASFYAAVPAADDFQLQHQPPQDDAKRLRRRSMHTLDSADYPNPLTPQEFSRPEEFTRSEPTTPKIADKDTKTLCLVTTVSGFEGNMRHRNGSSESLVSSRSSHSRPSSSTNRNQSSPTGTPPASAFKADNNSASTDNASAVNIPPRGSSSDVSKRTINPSPLSQPVIMAGDESIEDTLSLSGPAAQPDSPSTTSQIPNHESPAAKQLVAISQKGGKSKSKTSRLRRAFSFGSAAEFRKAGGEPFVNDGDKTEPSKLHKEPSATELYDAEQARIVKKQEEGGIGSSIYGARLFSGSTDNLSISSTASSASIMIRKMGRGVKRSTRSLVGLFRPKSIVGVPSIDVVSPEASEAAVSMITVEAERERVNVNLDPHDQPGGGTGFPHLERNSIDAAAANPPSSISERATSSGTDNSGPRKSIIGGERERVEVLAAVRRGILKNTNGSPTGSPVIENRDTVLDLPGIPSITDSPSSSAPSTPNEESQGHRRTGSVAIGNEDYFVAALRLRQDTKSAPGTPKGISKRNATFSPRIVFYDTWPSQEYDRRGEIATCNRLTPMLAQQIKEELNTFKMEMEVHENSKIYTHFF